MAVASRPEAAAPTHRDVGHQPHPVLGVHAGEMDGREALRPHGGDALAVGVRPGLDASTAQSRRGSRAGDGLAPAAERGARTANALDRCADLAGGAVGGGPASTDAGRFPSTGDADLSLAAVRVATTGSVDRGRLRRRTRRICPRRGRRRPARLGGRWGRRRWRGRRRLARGAVQEEGEDEHVDHGAGHRPPPDAGERSSCPAARPCLSNCSRGMRCES